MQNIDFSADNVMIVTTTMIFANFVNKFIPVQQTQMMMTNGQDAILAVDGYLLLVIQNHIECEKKFRNKDINEVKD